MFERQKSGSVVCPSCGRLVGVSEAKCPFCGRASPGMFGFAQALRKLGSGLGVVEMVVGGCVLLYLLTLVTDSNNWQSECLVFDARDITRGPICRVPLPQRVPAGFHASWARGEDLWK